MPAKALEPEEHEMSACVTAWRKHAGLSQPAVGEIVGITQQQVSLIERGLRRVHLVEAVRLARHLDMPIEELVLTRPLGIGHVVGKHDRTGCRSCLVAGWQESA